ncbi:MAG: RAD55 family ATPase [Candidatus Poseidoniaceae archaeon]|jgi:KaiC/GvpD/RAD55 family RecA-like ATPase|nr:RAD55 family ATPase [Candidatus Poseidoniaceae archaeon]|tara:strand:+ start:312 stop:1115 length:804 start_codon:yes stop_codon:yes gene_type:complete
MARKFDFDPEDEEFFSMVGSFGVPKFDNEMHGGIPRGFTLIAFTDTGSGSELFAKQFTSPAEESENTLYVSTNEGQAEIVRIFQKYSWPMDINVRTIGEEYNSTVLERELLASRYRLEGFQLADIQRLAQTRFVDETNQDYLTEVTNEIMALGPYFRAVVDSLDFFLQREDPARVVAMVRMLQAHAQLHRGLLLISVSTNGLDPVIKQELSSIADMVLSFKVRTIGTDFETSMIVSKFRNAPENLKILVFRVTPEEGITPETVERIA